MDQFQQCVNGNTAIKNKKEEQKGSIVRLFEGKLRD